MQPSLDFEYQTFHWLVADFTDHYYTINRKNHINMGGYGEDTSADQARRVCIAEGRQEHPRVHEIRRGPRRQIQATANSGETRRAAPQPGRLPKRLKSKLKHNQNFPR